MAPFSTLLTSDALATTSKYGYALPAGSATGGLVFGATGGPTYRNLFSVSVPAANVMEPFAQWVLTLPPSERQTAAYPEVNDPFADPPVTATQTFLAKHGVRTVYPANQLHPANTNAQIRAEAQAVAQRQPQIVVIGSVDLPSLLIFIHTFQAHNNYTPKVMIAASGPDQGQAFLNTLNPINAQAIMVPDAWSGATQNALSHVMVQDYIAKFGGTSSDINADVAEAYSAGEVLADAVKATHGTSNSKIISVPARRGEAADRAGTGAVHQDRPEHRADRIHLPVAGRQLQPGAAHGRGRVERGREPEAGTGERAAEPPGPLSARARSTTTSKQDEGHEAEMGRQLSEAIVNGILGGSIYALMAVGLTLIFGVLDIINIAQGILVVLGALPQLRALRPPASRPVRGPAGDRPGDVHRRGRDPVGLHQAAARPGTDLDVPARDLRGGDHHRGHPVHHLRLELREPERLATPRRARRSSGSTWTTSTSTGS